MIHIVMKLVVVSLIPSLGIWTLLIGACLGVENFTLKKLIGVFACFAGVVLTSGADISGDNDKNRGSFPHKSGQQISIGDALALLSAVLYGRPLFSRFSSWKSIRERLIFLLLLK